MMILAGCATNQSQPAERIVYRTKVVYLTPPAALLEKVSIVPPPNKVSFVTKTPEQRESILTDLYVEQTKQVAMCNRSLEGIDTWVEKSLVLHKEQEEKKN